MWCNTKAYADLCQIDYTNNANKYGPITGIPTSIDCLGFFFLISINKSENFIDTKDFIKSLGLDESKYSPGVMMHDE